MYVSGILPESQLDCSEIIPFISEMLNQAAWLVFLPQVLTHEKTSPVLCECNDEFDPLESQGKPFAPFPVEPTLSI